MIGILSSTLNIAGGAEFVTINIINALKSHGYKVALLTNEKMNQEKIKKFYGETVDVDAEITFPDVFQSYDSYGIYIRALKALLLKLRYNVVIDNLSSAVLPWTDISYIHFPFTPRLSATGEQRLKSLYFIPYILLLGEACRSIKSQPGQKIIFANSKFTSEAIKWKFGIDAQVLYPPVSTIYRKEGKITSQLRKNRVVTISRISKRKNLQIIPHIARKTNENIEFIIAGGYQSDEALYSILKLIKIFKLSKRVKVSVNLKRDQLIAILVNSKAYLHTMDSEHFGISIVEAMSAGCIPVVHDSGGPKEFVPEGLRYKTIDEAAEIIEKAASEWSPSHARRMIGIANRFNEEEFQKRFLEIVVPYIDNKRK